MNLIAYALRSRWVRGIAAIAITYLYYVCASAQPDGVLAADNTLLTISMITNEALRVLENHLTLLKGVNREYDDKFAVDGAKIGSVVNARKPPKYIGRTGKIMQIEDTEETSVPIELTTQFGVDVRFSSSDLALSIDMFSDRILKPAVATIANKLDSDLATLYNQLYNAVGTPGTTPNDLITYLLAGVRLDDGAAPVDEDRNIYLTPLMQAYIVDALKGLFQQSEAIARQYVKGRMGGGPAAGFNWFMDQNMPTHTVGPLGGTPLVNGANQTGSSLVTNGWTGAILTRLKKGDVFTVVGVNAVNPQSRQNIGRLQQFVALSDGASDGSGNMTISISPSIITAGAYQTVSASPAHGAALTILGAASTVSPQGIAMHRDCMTFVSADLPLPRGVDMAARVQDEQLGASIRMVRQYTISDDEFPCRLDILYGYAMLRPELGSRIAA